MANRVKNIELSIPNKKKKKTKITVAVERVDFAPMRTTEEFE